MNEENAAYIALYLSPNTTEVIDSPGPSLSTNRPPLPIPIVGAIVVDIHKPLDSILDVST